MEARVRRSDGQYRWHMIHCSPMRDETGLLVKWCGVATDVDDLRRAEETLQRRELDFQSIVDSIPIPVAVTTPTGEVEGLNQLTLDYFGKTFEELKGWQASEVVHPDDLERTIAAQLGAHQSGGSYNVESRHRRADGVYRWYNVLGMPLRDPQGNILRWFHLLIDIDDRKRAEEALRESESKARAIVDGIPGFVAIITPEGKTDVVNRQMAEYHGLTDEELRKWATNRTIHDDDLPGVTEIFNKAIATSTPYEIEYRLRRFDGVYRWFYSRGVPLRDASGNITCWYALQTDIEDRKRAEQALHESERNARLIVDSIPARVGIYDTDGTRISVNKQSIELSGLPSGSDWRLAFHPDDVARAESRWRESLASEEPFECEYRARMADGSYRWHLGRRVPMRDEAGKVIRWFGVSYDIDDRKRAEDALKRSEAFLAEGQYLARMGSLSWRVATGEIIWSDHLYRIFEFEPGTNVTLELIASRVHPEDMPMMTDMVQRVRRGEDDFEYQHRIVLPDQSVKYLHLIGHRVRESPDQMEYVGAVLDITQRQLSEQALEKVRSELAHVTRIVSLGVLTASIAHEVNQPLSGIITNAGTCLRMLAADPPNIDGARETARRTIRDGNRAADVIARLRGLFGKKAAAIEPVDLNEAVLEVIALLSSDLQRSRVVLRTELADGLQHVGGDRVQLQQVIMNLLRNAADAMDGVNDRPRRLLVRTEPDENNQVRLSVQDAGIGFGDQSAERLFEAFYTTKSGGMGIGLSVSRSIIESHSGRLWAQANDGPGATFSFSIPKYSGDESSPDNAGALLASATNSDTAVQRGLHERH